MHITHTVTNIQRKKIGLTCDFFHAYQKIATIRIQTNTRAMLTPATRKAKRKVTMTLNH